MAIQLIERLNNASNVPLRLAKGHFATSHSHINYYIDLTMTKHRLSEAREAAATLCSKYQSTTIVDTILCLDGMEVVGACMASELTRAGFSSMNDHRTIYCVTPEKTSGSQLIFRDNTAPMVVGKHVLILADTIATGYTVQAAIEAIRYYGGTVVGVCSIFTCKNSCLDVTINSIYTRDKDLPDYTTCPSTECALCKQGIKLDGLINSYGISTF